jgi:D-proline reductase (dithiol) PrdB
VGLVSRLLEANGIATVVMGSAMDIIAHCGVPRYLHSDLPLGNPCGVPFDSTMQEQILNQALLLLEEANSANSIVRSVAKWPGTPSWREDYSKVDESNREALWLKGLQRRDQQETGKAKGITRSAMIRDS